MFYKDYVLCNRCKYNNVVSTDLPYIHEVKTMYQTDISQNNNIEYEFFNFLLRMFVSIFSIFYFSSLDVVSYVYIVSLITVFLTMIFLFRVFRADFYESC